MGSLKFSQINNSFVTLHPYPTLHKEPPVSPPLIIIHKAMYLPFVDTALCPADLWDKCQRGGVPNKHCSCDCLPEFEGPYCEIVVIQTGTKKQLLFLLSVFCVVLYLCIVESPKALELDTRGGSRISQTVGGGVIYTWRLVKGCDFVSR